jgi:glycosyltransferase involved in cell wall biosynthesis
MREPLRDPLIDIVIPVYNEERTLADSVGRLRGYLERHFPFRWSIAIGDNASTDATPEIGRRLAAEGGPIRYVRLEQKGRGRALKQIWAESAGDVVVYMDVDLSTGLTALLPLVAPLVSGHAEVAIGSRLLAHSKVRRGAKREVLSRGYNLLIRGAFRPGFHDAQCGFKALRADAAAELLPLVEDTGWFFDTELLLLAAHNGLRVVEVPVDWDDDPDSRVHIQSTVTADLKGLWRMRRAFWAGRGHIGESAPVGAKGSVHV